MTANLIAIGIGALAASPIWLVVAILHFAN